MAKPLLFISHRFFCFFVFFHRGPFRLHIIVIARIKCTAARKLSAAFIYAVAQHARIRLGSDEFVNSDPKAASKCHCRKTNPRNDDVIHLILLVWERHSSWLVVMATAIDPWAFAFVLRRCGLRGFDSSSTSPATSLWFPPYLLPHRAGLHRSPCKFSSILY